MRGVADPLKRPFRTLHSTQAVWKSVKCTNWVALWHCPLALAIAHSTATVIYSALRPGILKIMQTIGLRRPGLRPEAHWEACSATPGIILVGDR